jgi:putative transposase
MAKKSHAKPLPVRGQAPGPLEGVDATQWKRLERIARAIRSLGTNPLTKTRAEQLAARFDINWRTIYRYRQRLNETDEVFALVGRVRGWRPMHSRLTEAQETAIEAAIRSLRKKPGPLRVVDLVEEVQARCRVLQVEAPCRDTIDARVKRAAGVRVCRRGVAPPGNADPRISPGSFVVKKRRGKQKCQRFFPLFHSEAAAVVDNFAVTPKKAKLSTRIRGKKTCQFASLGCHDAL